MPVAKSLIILACPALSETAISLCILPIPARLAALLAALTSEPILYIETPYHTTLEVGQLSKRSRFVTHAYPLPASNWQCQWAHGMMQARLELGCTG